jgi:GxxExxY protein
LGSQVALFAAMELNDLSYLIIQCGIEVHRILGPGLLESTYRKCMIYELGLHKLSVVSEKIVPVRYKELVLEAGYRVDLIVQDTIIVELKAVEHVLPVHQQQLLTYLKHMNKPLGLLMNFNVEVLTKGVTRIKNGY